MISDFETNTIYFSELIACDDRYKNCYDQIIKTLEFFNIKPHLIPKTKDIWARDYMPIQIDEERFIEYRYDPDYLQGHRKGYRDLKTYTDLVCDSLKLKTEKSDLILDGGNLIRSSNCLILTDKIISENRFSYSKNELIKKLHDIFKVEKVVLIPWYRKERYGHSDGVVRFVDNETVLVSQYYKNDTALLNNLKSGGLKPIFLEFRVKKSDSRNWAYINFLQTKDLILLPKLGIDEDIQAYRQIEEYYPAYKGYIGQVYLNDIIKFGGAFNCITWTIKLTNENNPSLQIR